MMTSKRNSRATRLPLVFVLCSTAVQTIAAEPLEQQLLKENAAELATAAYRQGDAQRGAVLFHQQSLGCAACHLPDGGRPAVGPDLTKPREGADDAYLIESVLAPSKKLRQGYETVQIVTDDGRTINGVVVEDSPDEVVLRVAEGNFELARIKKPTIQERETSRLSLMPTGLVNQLASHEQFLDLLRYVFEINEFGRERIAQLRPPPGLFSSPPLPEYERHLDHAGLLNDLNNESFQRGEAIYQRVCANCHGTRDRAGSLPASLRFDSGRFKNGADPYSIYRTLTYGFGLMAPQTWMVPREKYDVIHYLREACLKPHNPTQYVALNERYFSALPQGDTRGPEPSSRQPWVAMDYGDCLTNTYEVGRDGSNFAYKGIAIRLDPGPGGVSQGREWMIFDHDTLRVAAVWSRRDDGSPGFIDYQGIHFNGQHQVHPHIVGRLRFANAGLGWANPATRDFDDVRLRGRDGKPYGPLPRTWGHFQGLYHQGQRVVLSYRVGNTDVLEMPGIAEDTGCRDGVAFTRSFEMGPRATDMVLQVAEHPAKRSRLRFVDLPDRAPLVVVDADRSTHAAENVLTFDGATGLVVSDPGEFDLAGGDYTIGARIRTRAGGTIFCKTSEGDEWVPGGKVFFVRDGRLGFDVGWVGVVQTNKRIDDGQWHDVAATWKKETSAVRLFIDGRLEGQGVLRPGNRLERPVVRLAFGAPDFPQPQSYFLGEIDDVRFYSRALSGDELTRQTTSGENKSLVGHWRFAAAGGEKVRNLAGKGHDAVVVRSAHAAGADGAFVAGLSPDLPDARWSLVTGRLRLRIPAGKEPLKFTLWMSNREDASAASHVDLQPVDLSGSLHGSPPRWPEVLRTQAIVSADEAPFAIDVLTPPIDNPWSCQLRFTGFDFFDGSQALAACTWDGDVWLVRGVDQPEQRLTWQRIASGLFQPLGLKIVAGKIYVGCRDQIVVLHDLNGDGETDYYENFNSDHQVTEHFHEFAMGLQTDAAGNFYYAKSARHALPAVVPHHGTLLRVSKDGRRTDIVATGFRAANGVCLNDDGTFFVTDQEGHWTPKNRINYVEPGGFYGNMLGYHEVTDPSDRAMRQPLAWITNSFDRSPGELLRVTSDAWGPLKGALLELSYGTGKIFLVPHEKLDGQMQGGLCALPMPLFPTGVMRGRFHPTNGQLYCCGMFAWAGDQTSAGGFYRLRYTGKAVYMPLQLHARRDGMEIKFSGPLATDLAADPARYHVRIWSIKRTANYGSAHHEERELEVAAATLSADQSSVFLQLPGLQPTWCMSIAYRLKSADGTPVVGEIHNTIHRLEETTSKE